MATGQTDPIAECETQRPPMERMLQDLPAHHREIIVATYFRHRTTREAAHLLGITPAAVQALLYEAMRELSRMVATCRPDHAGYCLRRLAATPSGADGRRGDRPSPRPMTPLKRAVTRWRRRARRSPAPS